MKIPPLPTEKERKKKYTSHSFKPIQNHLNLDLATYLSFSCTFSRFRYFTLKMVARHVVRKASCHQRPPGSFPRGSGGNANLQPVPQSGEANAPPGSSWPFFLWNTLTWNIEILSMLCWLKKHAFLIAGR